MRLRCAALTLLYAIEDFARYLLTAGRWDMTPVSGHVFEETRGGWRCRCGAAS